MTEASDFKTYIVALVFADGGPLCASAVIAPSPELASASFVAGFLQATKTDKPLMGAVVVAIEPEFLRVALRATEGRLAPNGENVLSLVPGGEAPVRQEHVGEARWWGYCQHGVVGEQCPICSPEPAA